MTLSGIPTYLLPSFQVELPEAHRRTRGKVCEWGISQPGIPIDFEDDVELRQTSGSQLREEWFADNYEMVSLQLQPLDELLQGGDQ